MKKSNKAIIKELQSLSVVQNSTLKGVLYALTELSREAEDNDVCYETMRMGLMGLKKVRTGAFGSGSYNKAIDDALALIDGIHGDYKNDSYRKS